MLIRDARLSEAGAIASLYVRTRRKAYASFFPADVLAAMSVSRESERWRRRLVSPSARALVVEDGDGALAGFVHVRWQDGRHPDTGEVEYMYVATERQGEGLGARLMAEAEAALAGQGLRDAVLWVYEENSLARRFYERCGWADDGGRRVSGSAPGKHLARYRKQIARGLSRPWGHQRE